MALACLSGTFLGLLKLSEKETGSPMPTHEAVLTAAFSEPAKVPVQGHLSLGDEVTHLD